MTVPSIRTLCLQELKAQQNLANDLLALLRRAPDLIEGLVRRISVTLKRRAVHDLAGVYGDTTREVLEQQMHASNQQHLFSESLSKLCDSPTHERGWNGIHTTLFLVDFQAEWWITEHYFHHDQSRMNYRPWLCMRLLSEHVRKSDYTSHVNLLQWSMGSVIHLPTLLEIENWIPSNGPRCRQATRRFSKPIWPYKRRPCGRRQRHIKLCRQALEELKPFVRTYQEQTGVYIPNGFPVWGEMEAGQPESVQGLPGSCNFVTTRLLPNLLNPWFGEHCGISMHRKSIRIREEKKKSREEDGWNLCIILTPALALTGSRLLRPCKVQLPWVASTDIINILSIITCMGESQPALSGRQRPFSFPNSLLMAGRAMKRTLELFETFTGREECICYYQRKIVSFCKGDFWHWKKEHLVASMLEGCNCKVKFNYHYDVTCCEFVVEAVKENKASDIYVWVPCWLLYMTYMHGMCPGIGREEAGDHAIQVKVMIGEEGTDGRGSCRWGNHGAVMHVVIMLFLAEHLYAK